jgi:hypothetical protein
MLQQALQKLQAEITGNPKNSYVQAVGGFLIKHVQSNPKNAALFIAEGKTIAGSLEAMKTEAQKKKSGNVGVLTDEEGFNIVLKYYGVKVPETVPPQATAASFDASLDDLLE